MTLPPTFDRQDVDTSGDGPDNPSPVVVLAELTGHLSSGVDTPYLLHVVATRTRDVLDAAAVSVVMDAAFGPGGQDFELVMVASSGSVDRSLSVTGPATMCVRTGAAVLADDLEFPRADGRTTRARRAARASAASAPTRCAFGRRTIGAVVVHTVGPWRSTGSAAAFVQAVADLTALAVSADTDGDERLSAEARRRRRVLDDSAVIDQAIGVLAELRGVDISTATAMLVADARRALTPLSERARAVIASGD